MLRQQPHWRESAGDLECVRIDRLGLRTELINGYSEPREEIAATEKSAAIS